MTNYETIATELVENGANVLDVVLGDVWLERMPEDETDINFMDSFRCPLRYAFGDFLFGDRALAQKGYYGISSYGFAHPSEFNNLPDDEMLKAYAAVDAAWHKLIKTRRADQD
jgi:hypothetical protein